MKIFLPFTIKGIGGTATFALKFKSGMEQQGHEVFFDYREDYDVLFLIVQCPLAYLWDAKKKGKKIIQRLDGTYYWSVSGWKYTLYNLKAKIIRHFFTDFTIYQSEYSKYCAEKFLGKKHSDPSSLIYNGVDLELFSSKGDTINIRDNPQQKIFFTASAFRRKDQIIPILQAMERYRTKYSDDFKLLVAGTFSPAVSHIPAQWSHFKNIHFLGKINNEDLPRYERSSDVFLFTHLNPPCPNNVIEAMACGLPICGVADGAMNELVRTGVNGELIPVSGDAFWKQRIYDSDAFTDNLKHIVDHQKEYSQQSRKDALDRFSIHHMIGKYAEILNSLTKKQS